MLLFFSGIETEKPAQMTVIVIIIISILQLSCGLFFLTARKKQPTTSIFANAVDEILDFELYDFIVMEMFLPHPGHP